MFYTVAHNYWSSEMVYLVVLGVVFIGPIVMGAALLVILDHTKD